MPAFAVLVEVRLRPGIADPQGATIERSLPHLSHRWSISTYAVNVFSAATLV